MLNIAKLRERLADGNENPRWVAVDIQDDPEIKAAYLDYECSKLAQGATRAEVEAMLGRLEHWRKEDMR